MKRLTLIASVCLVLSVVAGCTSYDKYYLLDKDYLKRRQTETRHFDVNDEESMLVASAQVLQDLEFTLETSETGLGLLTATKKREVKLTGGTVAKILLSALTGTPQPVDVEQTLYVTLVTNKNADGDGYTARVSFARIVLDSYKNTRVERITDAKINKDFFDKLSQSLFLTENNL